MFFGGQGGNPVLSPMLAYPTELLRQIYAMPLFPQSFLPFNLLLTLNAIRLNLEFTKAQRGADKPYLHSLLSVIILPCMSGLVGAVLLQQTPGFIVSETFLPTHFFVHLFLYLFPFVKALLLSLPPLAVELPLIITDSFLRSLAITSAGTDLALASAHRNSWITQIAMGGIAGAASAVLLLTCNLWSPAGWHVSSVNLSSVPWDVYGPFVLSMIYVALRGTHPAINNLTLFATAGVWGGKGTYFLTAEEARTVVALIFATVVTLRRLGIYSFALGGPSKAQGRRLGDKKEK